MGLCARCANKRRAARRRPMRNRMLLLTNKALAARKHSSPLSIVLVVWQFLVFVEERLITHRIEDG